ncbi:Synaptobrevin [Tyrophagus putrescentiae]|nr:Synaptobrevin [Tyrophagus putrescentiae]
MESQPGKADTNGAATQPLSALSLSKLFYPTTTTTSNHHPVASSSPSAQQQPPDEMSNQHSGSSKRLQQTQAQVDEVVGIMRTNVEKVLERDQKLSELDDRADALQQGASQFEQQAGKLKRKYWWKNIKLMLILAIILIVIIIIIIVGFEASTMSRSHSSTQPANGRRQRRPSSRPLNPNSRFAQFLHFEQFDENFSFISPYVKYFLFFFNLIVWSGLINIECGFNMQNISSVVEVNKDIYTRGCIEAITETLEPNMNMVSIGCFVFAIVQLFAMFLARSLQGQIKSQLSRWERGGR